MTSEGTTGEAWTVGRLLQWTAAWFADRQVEGGRLAAELLLARAMECRKIELYTRYEQEPTEPQRAVFRDLVRQAGDHTPIAYLLGEREFFSLSFKVTPAVLIPRPETEALVQRAVEICRESAGPCRVLDVGTGSGCIAVAVARYADAARVIATDISAEALAIAAENIERQGVAERVQLREADLVALSPETVGEGVDVVVSNPPYIDRSQWPGLPPHIREHEPRLALMPPDGDGLSVYRRLAAEAPAVLKRGGRLLAEIGQGRGDAVRAAFADTGRWSYAGSHRDPTDPHERVLEFVLNGSTH